LLYLVLSVLAVIVLFPLYFLLVLSLGPASATNVGLLPDIHTLTLANYKWVLVDSEFLTWIKNSVLVGSISTAIGVFVSILAAYSLARFKFRGRTVFGATVVATQLLPTIVLAIPMFIILVRLHLNNSYTGLIITYMTLIVPFGTWMLSSYFTTLPRGLEEAARIDGCSSLGVLLRIILPISTPGIAVVILFGFTIAWSDFLFALLIMASPDKLTATVGASLLASDQGTLLGDLSAYGMLTLLPVVAIFVVLQRYLTDGLTAGAIQ
jgi:multiple sugar transport system permease protein